MIEQFKRYLNDERLWLGDYSDHQKYYGVGYYPNDIELKPLKDEVTEFFKKILPEDCVIKFCNFVKKSNSIRLTVDYDCKRPGFFEGVAYYKVDDIMKMLEENKGVV
jgi:hypothetical protein